VLLPLLLRTTTTTTTTTTTSRSNGHQLTWIATMGATAEEEDVREAGNEENEKENDDEGAGKA
jgi:hypothetical protein